MKQNGASLKRKITNNIRGSKSIQKRRVNFRFSEQKECKKFDIEFKKQKYPKLNLQSLENLKNC